jgi:hypothetical protein
MGAGRWAAGCWAAGLLGWVVLAAGILCSPRHQNNLQARPVTQLLQHTLALGSARETRRRSDGDGDGDCDCDCDCDGTRSLSQSVAHHSLTTHPSVQGRARWSAEPGRSADTTGEAHWRRSWRSWSWRSWSWRSWSTCRGSLAPARCSCSLCRLDTTHSRSGSDYHHLPGDGHMDATLHGPPVRRISLCPAARCLSRRALGWARLSMAAQPSQPTQPAYPAHPASSLPSAPAPRGRYSAARSSCRPPLSIFPPFQPVMPLPVCWPPRRRRRASPCLHAITVPSAYLANTLVCRRRLCPHHPPCPRPRTLRVAHGLLCHALVPTALAYLHDPGGLSRLVSASPSGAAVPECTLQHPVAFGHGATLPTQIGLSPSHVVRRPCLPTSCQT